MDLYHAEIKRKKNGVGNGGFNQLMKKARVVADDENHRREKKAMFVIWI